MLIRVSDFGVRNKKTRSFQRSIGPGNRLAARGQQEDHLNKRDEPLHEFERQDPGRESGLPICLRAMDRREGVVGYGLRRPEIRVRLRLAPGSGQREQCFCEPLGLLDHTG